MADEDVDLQHLTPEQISMLSAPTQTEHDLLKEQLARSFALRNKQLPQTHSFLGGLLSAVPGAVAGYQQHAAQKDIQQNLSDAAKTKALLMHGLQNRAQDQAPQPDIHQQAEDQLASLQPQPDIPAFPFPQGGGQAPAYIGHDAQALPGQPAFQQDPGQVPASFPAPSPQQSVDTAVRSSLLRGQPSSGGMQQMSPQQLQQFLMSVGGGTPDAGVGSGG